MKLSDIADNAGSRKKRMRVGRGIGSGKGKTSGRGGKGQTARSGVRIKGFEGGQMPLHRRLPKRGFNNIFRLDFVEINLDRLQQAIDAKLLDAGATINAEALVKSRVLRRARDGVRPVSKRFDLLADGAHLLFGGVCLHDDQHGRQSSGTLSLYVRAGRGQCGGRE